MALFALTEQQIRDLNDFLEGTSTSVISDGTLKYFFAVSSQLRNQLLKTAVTSVGQKERAEAKLEQLKAKQVKKYEQGSFTELGFDSLELAACLTYYLQQMKAWKLSKAKVEYILFEAYASWLESKGERLCVEAPVATSLGPWFWRVSHRLNLDVKRTYDDVRKIQEQNPGVAKFLENVARKYYDYSESQLKNYFCKQQFYREALPEMNGGKWNKTLSDASIWQWKRAQK